MHFIGENWEMIKQTIHTEYDLTNISYNTWIEPLQFYDVKDDTVYIQIPTGQAHALNYHLGISTAFVDMIRGVINICHF